MEKIYGVYTGKVDMSMLDNLHEIDVWKKIEDIGASLFWSNHDAADGRTKLSDKEREIMIEMQYLLEYLVYYTRKFGVTFNRTPKAGEHVERSEDYNKWYSFWDSVVKSWSDKQLKEFIERREKGECYLDLLPETNWKGEVMTDSGLNV